LEVGVASQHKLHRQTPPLLGLLDIGTAKTVCFIVAAARRGREGPVDVLGIGQQPSRGLKAGVVIELDAAEQCVRAAVSEAERAAGCELRQVLLAVACGRLKSTTFAAEATIEGRAVMDADMARLMSAGRSYVERDGRALLHMNAIGYRLDAAQGIADPRGLAAKVVSVDLHAVTADDAPLRNLVHVAERAYLSVIGLVPAPYASALGVTTPEERKAGVMVLDFGAGTTGLAVFVDGHLLASEVVPVGGHHVVADDLDLPGRRLDEADERPHEGRLARAREAHDDEHLAGPDLDRDVIDGDDAPRLLALLGARKVGVRRPDELVPVRSEDLPHPLGADRRLARIVDAVPGCLDGWLGGLRHTRAAEISLLRVSV